MAIVIEIADDSKDSSPNVCPDNLMTEADRQYMLSLLDWPAPGDKIPAKLAKSASAVEPFLAAAALDPCLMLLHELAPPGGPAATTEHAALESQLVAPAHLETETQIMLRVMVEGEEEEAQLRIRKIADHACCHATQMLEHCQPGAMPRALQVPQESAGYTPGSAAPEGEQTETQMMLHMMVEAEKEEEEERLRIQQVSRPKSDTPGSSEGKDAQIKTGVVWDYMIRLAGGKSDGQLVDHCHDLVHKLFRIYASSGCRYIVGICYDPDHRYQNRQFGYRYNAGIALVVLLRASGAEQARKQNLTCKLRSYNECVDVLCIMIVGFFR